MVSPVSSCTGVQSGAAGRRLPRGAQENPRPKYERLAQARGDSTARLGRQNSKLCIPNDRHRTRALPQKG
jgi:hypothetical protein